MIFINEIYDLSNGGIKKLTKEEYPTIDGIQNIIPLEKISIFILRVIFHSQ